MYDTILVPTDGSTVAETAIDHAVDLASQYDADVHALYVVDLEAVDAAVSTQHADRIGNGDLSDFPELEERGQIATGSVAETADAAGLSVTESVVTGTPHERIASYAEDSDVDLIVMGSAGRGGVSRVLLGSVAERTLRSTSTPVLVVDVREHN